VERGSGILVDLCGDIFDRKATTVSEVHLERESLSWAFPVLFEPACRYIM